MNKKHTLLPLTLALLLASCAKSDELTAPPADSADQQVTLNITIESPTTEGASSSSMSRTEVDGLNVSWAEGDKITLYNDTSSPGTISSYSTMSVSSVTGNVVNFNGTLSSNIDGYVSAFYPAEEAYLNTGTGTEMYLSTLRIVQPTYLQFDYTSSGELEPSSIGQYAYMHMLSNESVEESTALTGTMKQLMSFVEINLANPKDEVERVYISLSSPLSMDSMKVASDGTVTYDDGLDYVVNTTGTHATYKLYIDRFIIELRGSDGELGVSKNSSNTIPLVLPLIPQSMTQDFTLFVCYADGREDIITKTMSKDLEAGYFYNVGSTIDLGGATTLSDSQRTPKIGDYYYSDDSWSATLNSQKSVEGIIYELTGDGTETKVSKIFNPQFRKLAFMDSSFLGGVSLSSTFGGINNATGLSNITALVAAAQSFSSSKLSGATSAQAVCDIAFPSLSYALSLNDSNPDSFSGDETGYWYIPSTTENIWMTIYAAKVQGHKTVYINEQMKQLPTSIIGGWNEWNNSSVSVGDDGDYFNPIVTDKVVQYGSSSSYSNGGYYYVRSVNLHSMYNSGTNYISQGYTTSATTELSVRAIKRIN